jgi:4-hydroxy-2-oxoheptanedioate aldolase
MRPNRTKQLLRDGKTAYGCFVRYPDSTLVEVMGYHGWDFFVFDGEHGTLEPSSCEDMVRAADLRDVTAVVRVPTNQPHVILRFLDTGALGCQVPWVQTPEDAERAVQSVKYQPRGARGLAGVRVADYGELGGLGDYVRSANEETLVVVQVESASAVGHVDEIAAIDDVDVVFIGPTDLSNSLGLAGDLGHPTVVEHLERAAAGILAAGKVLGVTVSDAETAKTWMQRGARYVTTGVDPILGAGTSAFLGHLKT